MLEDWRGILINKFYSKLKEGSKVLDLGTGFLSNLEILVDTVIFKAIVWTVDIDKKPLNKAIKNYTKYVKLGRLKPVQANVEELPFEDNFFDLVVSTLLMHHIGNIPKALSEMYRVLKQGGTLVIVDWDVGGQVFTPHSSEQLETSKKEVLSHIGKLRLKEYKIEEHGEWYLVYGKK